MLGIYAEPPIQLHDWTGIYLKQIKQYIYMLVMGNTDKMDNKYKARAASLSIKNTVGQN